MRKVLALAAGVAAFSTMARAEDDGVRKANREDVRCALAMTVMMRDEAYRQPAALGLYYFVGRLKAREPEIELAQAMRREAAGMQNSEWKGEFQRCGAAVQAETQALEDLKGAFQSRGVGRR